MNLWRTGRRPGAAAVAALALLAGSAAALPPGRALPQLVAQHWTNEHGLPQNAVQALCQTRDGYVWLGTQDGLARFDGVRFTTFDKTTTPGLASNAIWGLAEDREGALWVATNGGAVRMVDGRVVGSIGQRDGLNDLARAVYQDRRGALWVATSGGLGRLQGGRIEAFTAASGLPTSRLRTVREDAAGNLYLGTSAGLVLWRERAVEGGVPASLAAQAIGALAPASGGGLWVGTLGAGLARLRGETVEFWGLAEGLPNASVWAVLEDRDGNVWIGTEGGLARLSRSRGLEVARRGALADRVWSLLEDHEGGIWVGTDGGVVRLSTGKLLAYTSADGLPSDSVASVLEDRGGRLFLGTNGGLVQLASGRVVRTLAKKDGLPADRVWALAEASDGSIYVGTDEGVGRLDAAGKVTAIVAPEGVRLTRIRAVVEYGGDLWVGTLGGGAVRLPGGAAAGASAFGVKDGLASEQVRALLAAGDGSLWIGQSGGLSRLKDGRVTTYRASNGMPNDQVTCLAEDAGGTLWVGTYGGGLLRFSGGHFTQVTTREGMHNDVVFQVLLDDAGGVWTTSGKGIARVSREELAGVARGTASRVSPRVFARSEGMPDPDCNGGSQPAGWRSRDGLLWFPTVRGVVVIDPKQIPFNAMPPPVVVEEVLADQKPLDMTGSGGAPISLAPGTDAVEIRYAATSFNAPQKVRFRYRLDGYDRASREAGTRRTAYYTNLPPRQYVFHVEACNEDGVWNERGASLRVELRPFFYQTGAFRAAAVVALSLLGLAGYRLRVRGLTRRAEELDRLVREKTRSLDEAQAKIARLAESAGKALLDMRAWAQGAAEEIAASVGAREIGVFLLEKESVSPLLHSGVRTPSLDEVRRRSGDGQGGLPAARDGETIVPVEGISGEILGALLVVGKAEGSWDEGERRLISGFAHQLGSALEVQRLRRDLDDARERRAATRRELLERGVALLQVCPACQRCYDQEVSACLVDGAALDGSSLLPFRVEGRYRLARVIGQGGMGTVFEARDERLDREVALKIVRADRWDQPDARLRFEQEARTIARIGHPGVVLVHDSGELQDGSAFIVMELLRGRDLAALMELHGRGTPRQVAALLRQGAAALGAAHRAGVIHRDIKPANVFLLARGGELEVKLLDFGLAKTFQIDTALTRAGMVVGTPSFMSAEQLLGKELGPQSDVYSFAAVAFEALTGRPLVDARQFAEVCAEVLQGLPRRVSDVLERVPREVDEAFAAALRRDPAERPADVEAWVASFVATLETMPAGVPGWPASIGGRQATESAPDLPTRAIDAS